VTRIYLFIYSLYIFIIFIIFHTSSNQTINFLRLLALQASGAISQSESIVRVYRDIEQDYKTFVIADTITAQELFDMGNFLIKKKLRRKKLNEQQNFNLIKF